MIAAAFLTIACRAWFDVTDRGQVSHAGVYCVKIRPSDMRGKDDISCVSKVVKRMKAGAAILIMASSTKIVTMVGWTIVTLAFVGACAILAFAMMPSGWQKIHARVKQVFAQSRKGTDAQITYAFGSRELSARIFLKSHVSAGEIVVVEYNAFEPERVRETSWSKRDAVFYGLPLTWSVILTGFVIIFVTTTNTPTRVQPP